MKPRNNANIGCILSPQTNHENSNKHCLTKKLLLVFWDHKGVFPTEFMKPSTTISQIFIMNPHKSFESQLKTSCRECSHREFYFCMTMFAPILQPMRVLCLSSSNEKYCHTALTWHPSDYYLFMKMKVWPATQHYEINEQIMKLTSSRVLRGKVL